MKVKQKWMKYPAYRAAIFSNSNRLFRSRKGQFEDYILLLKIRQILNKNYNKLPSTWDKPLSTERIAQLIKMQRSVGLSFLNKTK